MRTPIIIAALACALPLLPATANPPPASSYAGEQTRSIKALSEADIPALRGGQGMGMARAAELNRYPGPMHVLELGDRLELNEAQRQQVSDIMARMRAAAMTLGTELIERERALDQAFAGGMVTAEDMSAAATAIGALQGRLRAVHLAAHLETKVVLSPHQIVRYQTLRGYDGAAETGHAHPAHEHRHR